MKITLSTSPLNLNEVTHEWLEAQLAGIASRRRIDEAIVRVTRHAEASPPWEVAVHLVTPGPDLAASTRGHTLAAAFAQNLREMESTLRVRAAKRARRLRTRGPANAPAAYI